MIQLSDQVLVALISALGSVLVAYITSRETRKKNESDSKKVDKLAELEKENTELKKKLEDKHEDLE